MRLVEIIRRPTEAERSALVAAVDDLTERVGFRPLSDHLWLDLTGGEGDGFVAARIVDESGTVAYGQISATNESSSLEVVARPGLADERPLRDDLAETLVDTFRRDGGTALTWWLDAEQADAAERLGFAPMRSLHEMRRSLPLDEPASIETRSFVPGVDDAAFLAVNNRAFAGHGEQGGWTAETLALRLAAPWFDPDGFRLHERDGRLAGFCWTKLHTDEDPVVGEIYVIAVDPDHHGQGLGRQLTLAGLDSITARDVTTANLYVDADNAAAVGLYDRLGFTIHRTRTAFATRQP